MDFRPFTSAERQELLRAEHAWNMLAEDNQSRARQAEMEREEMLQERVKMLKQKIEQLKNQTRIPVMCGGFVLLIGVLIGVGAYASSKSNLKRNSSSKQDEEIRKK